MAQFQGSVEVLNNQNVITIKLDGQTGGIVIGTNNTNGSLTVKDASAKDSVRLLGNGKEVYIYDDAGNYRVRVIGKQGRVILRDAAQKDGVELLGDGKEIYVNDDAGNYRVRVIGKQGRIILRDAAKKDGIELLGDGKEIYVNDDAGNYRVRMIGTQGRIILRDASKKNGIELLGDGKEIYVNDNTGNYRIRMIGQQGRIILRDSALNERIRIDGQAGDISLQGADCAEEFDIVDLEEIDPGTVLTIAKKGKLMPCRMAYDKKVAGVISGAKGLKPGIILGKNLSQNKSVPIALSGRVYCKVDTQYSSIKVGDLLTTSPTLGHAMKAGSPQKAFGAVIGKALSDIKKGKGMIPILVALQ